MCVFERERETKHLQKAIYVITSKEEIGKPSDKPNGARTYGGSIPDGNSIRFLVDPAVKWVPASSRDLGDGKVAGERRREGPSQKQLVSVEFRKIQTRTFMECILNS